MITEEKSIHQVIKAINSKSCPKQINLHCHTISSDGSLKPVDLFEQACNIGLKDLAITDHHSISSYFEIINSKVFIQSLSPKPRLWTGLEISSILKGCLVHILALDFNPNSAFLSPYTKGESVRGSLLNATSVINNIHSASGLAILAHPARYRVNFNELIEAAASNGIDGIEVWYDYNMSTNWQPTEYICNEIEKKTKALGLFSTCGTDTHGLSLSGR